MRLYTFEPAPNPTKVGVYLREKGIELETRLVNLVKGEQHEPEFLALNPLGALPVLELDDGSHLAESLAIIEYFEELHPEPPMIGRVPLERARVRSLERTIDMGILGRGARLVHAKRSPLPGVEPDLAFVEREAPRLVAMMQHVDARIGSSPFVAGKHPTIADCTLFAGIRFAGFGGFAIDPSCRNLARWYEAFGARPSANPS